MAHPEQQIFIKNCISKFSNIVENSSHVLEVGSQDINGSIRDYFPNAETKVWLGLDLAPGKNVDFTIPGELAQIPTGWSDISFSTECFEHAENWNQILLNMIRSTKEGGIVVLTFAGNGRAAHGTVDTTPGDSPFTTSYYMNISVKRFISGCDLDKYFAEYSIESDGNTGDVYFCGLRNSCIEDTESMEAEDALARARGQLQMALDLNLSLKKDLNTATAEVIRLNAEVARFKLALRNPLLAFVKFMRRYIR